MLIYSTKGSLGKENELVISQTGRGNTTSDKQFQKKYKNCTILSVYNTVEYAMSRRYIITNEWNKIK